MKKKSQMDINFLPRNERVKKIQVPQDTIGCVYIKPNKEGLGYRLDCYNKEVIGNRVSEARFRETVFNCSKICQKVWSRKRIMEEVDPMHKAKIQMLFSSILLIFGIVLFLLSAYLPPIISDNDSEIMSILGCVLFIIQFFIGIFIIIRELSQQDIARIDLEVQCKLELRNLLLEENEFYNKNGLHWVIGQDFFWLELYIMLGK